MNSALEVNCEDDQEFKISRNQFKTIGSPRKNHVSNELRNNPFIQNDKSHQINFSTFPMKNKIQDSIKQKISDNPFVQHDIAHKFDTIRSISKIESPQKKLSPTRFDSYKASLIDRSPLKKLRDNPFIKNQLPGQSETKSKVKQSSQLRSSRPSSGKSLSQITKTSSVSSINSEVVVVKSSSLREDLQTPRDLCRMRKYILDQMVVAVDKDIKKLRSNEE